MWDYNNIDYTKIDDYDFFVKFVSHIISSKKNLYNQMLSDPEKYKQELENISEDDVREMLINPLELIIKDVDLADFSLYETPDKELILYNKQNNATIDKNVYMQIVDVVRKIHGLQRNNEIPGNERTKMDMIDDARDEAMLSLNKPYKSVLKPLISSLMVKCGMCGDDSIWNMKISMFFDSIKRISRIQDAELLLQGAYSGFASLKGIDKSRLDWAGDI